MRDFIKDNSRKNQKNRKHHKVFGFIDLFIKDPLPENVDILSVISEVEKKVPFHLANEIEVFYVGLFKEFEEKQVNAMYKDGAIYISSQQDDNPDMVDDIIHEIAHAIEDIRSREIYSDGRIQDEFLGKMERLKELLLQYGHTDAPVEEFSKLEYSKSLDDYLYKNLGYEKLNNFCLGLFTRPYAATGVREYFATAFEEYLLEDRGYLKKISPVAYEKVHAIISEV
jgi:hypothetical protein